MANNLNVKDANNATRQLKTTEQTGGIHVPFHNIDQDFFMRVAGGDVTGHEVVHVQGTNLTITNTTIEDLWKTEGTRTVLAAATVMSLTSTSANDTSAGIGAKTVTVEGVNGSYVETSETVTMAGTAYVGTSNSYLRINKLYVATAGTSAGNVGDITIITGSSPDIVHAEIKAGDGRAMQTHYTVPAGKTAYMGSYSVTTELTTGIRYRLMRRTAGGVVLVEDQADVPSVGYHRRPRAFKPFQAQEDIWFQASRVVSTGDVSVNAAYDLIVATNTV